jgi:hypothetical protein
MCHGWNDRPFVRAHWVDLDHKRIRHGVDKVLLQSLLQDGGGKGPELLAVLDLRVTDPFIVL